MSAFVFFVAFAPVAFSSQEAPIAEWTVAADDLARAPHMTEFERQDVGDVPAVSNAAAIAEASRALQAEGSSLDAVARSIVPYGC
ncbi:MAG: hypothetical protein LBR89_03445 [Holosporales bacterium]|nr:hypothetical protein [Holosporales bacterium]